MLDIQTIELKNTYQILIGRLLIIGFALSAFVLQKFEKIDTQTTTIYHVFVVYSIISLLYFLIVKLFPVQRTYIFFQLIINVLIITLFSTITGLTDSIFNNLYFIIIITGCIFLSFTQGLLLAIISAFSLSSISYAVHTKIIKILPDSINYDEFLNLDLNFIFAKLFTLTLGMIVVAVLSGYLAATYKHESVVLSEILANLSNGVLVVDTKNKISFINKEFLNLFELYENPVAYQNHNYEELEKRINCPLINKFLLKLDHNSEEYTHTFEDKSEKLLEVRSVPLLKSGSSIKASIFIVTDRSLQKEIKAINIRNQRLSIVNDLAANIVHEIRNPIASISGAVQEVQRTENELDKSSDKLLNIVLKESDRLSEIVTGFLEYSRLKAEANTVCHLNSIMQDLITIIKQDPRAKNIQINFSPKNDFFCHGNSDQLRQVFLNLTINALDVLKDDGKISFSLSKMNVSDLEHHLRKYFEDKQEVVCVHISDNGPGISPEVLKKIFDPFFTTKASGTGLGLSIVQKIVESQGGYVQVKSEVGNGTEFSVYLNIEDKDE